jgi:hypothetical protein
LFLREGLDEGNQIEMVREINSCAHAVVQPDDPSRGLMAIKMRDDLPDEAAARTMAALNSRLNLFPQTAWEQPLSSVGKHDRVGRRRPTPYCISARQVAVASVQPISSVRT